MHAFERSPGLIPIDYATDAPQLKHKKYFKKVKQQSIMKHSHAIPWLTTWGWFHKHNMIRGRYRWCFGLYPIKIAISGVFVLFCLFLFHSLSLLMLEGHKQEEMSRAVNGISIHKCSQLQGEHFKGLLIGVKKATDRSICEQGLQM